MDPIGLDHRVRRAAPQFATAFLDPRCGGLEREVQQLLVVVAIRDADEGTNLGIRQFPVSESCRHRRQGFQGVRHSDLLPRGAQAQVTTPVQPVRTVQKTPLEPAGAFVELADEHQEFVGGGIDSGGKIDDGAV